MPLTGSHRLSPRRQVAEAIPATTQPEVTRLTITLCMVWLRRFSRGTLQITFIVLALLIGLRVALPYIVKNYVNDKLDEMPEYSGHIGDVDMHLWRGAYSIQGIEIIKTDGKVPVPFLMPTG